MKYRKGWFYKQNSKDHRKKRKQKMFRSRTEQLTGYALLPPMTLRMPISFARRMDCAVDKLTKLTAAII